MARPTDQSADSPLRERSLLEAEHLALDARLRDFGPVRQSVIDADGNPDDVRQLMLRRRDWTAEQLQKLKNRTADPPDKLLAKYKDESDANDLTTPLHLLPISAGIFGAGLGTTGAFGYSGSVQMPRATDHDVVVPGRAGTSGEIVATQRRALGGVHFSGRLASNISWFANASWSGNPVLNLWSRSWEYVVPFPSPPVDSVLSYGVNVAVYLSAERERGEAEFMSAVALGHTPSLASRDINVNTFGWPLRADLAVPERNYNGSSGTLFGKTTVRRSLGIPAGQTPAMKMVLTVYGVIGAPLNRNAVCNFLSDSLIRPEDDAGLEGRISFHCRPLRPSVEN